MCVFQKRYGYKIKDLNIFLEVEGFLVGLGRQLRQKRTHSVSPRVDLVCPKLRPRQGEEQLFPKNARRRKLINSVSAPFSTTMTVLGKETCSRDFEFPLLCADFCACLSP